MYYSLHNKNGGEQNTKIQEINQNRADSNKRIAKVLRRLAFTIGREIRNRLENESWREYLRRKQEKWRKKEGRKVHRVRIPDRVSIYYKSIKDQK